MEIGIAIYIGAALLIAAGIFQLTRHRPAGPWAAGTLACGFLLLAYLIPLAVLLLLMGDDPQV